MAKGFVAIDINKKVFEFSEAGINNLKILHQNQGVSKDWQYGKKEDKDILLKNIVTPEEAKNALDENAILKQKIAEYEAANKKGAKAQKESDNTEK